MVIPKDKLKMVFGHFRSAVCFLSVILTGCILDYSLLFWFAIFYSDYTSTHAPTILHSSSHYRVAPNHLRGKVRLKRFENRYFRYMDYDNVVEFHGKNSRIYGYPGKEMLFLWNIMNSIKVSQKNLPDLLLWNLFLRRNFHSENTFSVVMTSSVKQKLGVQFLETNANTPGMIESCHVSKYLFPSPLSQQTALP